LHDGKGEVPQPRSRGFSLLGLEPYFDDVSNMTDDERYPVAQAEHW
jgi:hypothetical protein